MKQLMGYKVILEKYSGQPIIDYKCYLVGREVGPILQSTNLSGSGFFVKTYTDFIGEARQFYEDYLQIVEEDGLWL